MNILRKFKKTNEEIYEGNIRSDFSTTRTVVVATIIEDYFCILWSSFWNKR